MFMRHPSYLGEYSGSQAIAGESSRILKQSWNNPKIVSQTVSHRLPHFPNSLLLKQLELEARVGIGLNHRYGYLEINKKLNKFNNYLP
jgi:hypothetical protein